MTSVTQNIHSPSLMILSLNAKANKKIIRSHFFASASEIIGIFVPGVVRPNL